MNATNLAQTDTPFTRQISFSEERNRQMLLMSLYYLALAIWVVSLAVLFGCVVVRSWSLESHWPRLTRVSLLGALTALGLAQVLRGRVDTTVELDAVQRMLASLTGRPILALLLVGLSLLAVWVYRQQRWTMHMTIIDGQVRDDGPRSPTVSPTPNHAQKSSGLAVIVHLAGGLLRPERYEQVIPLRFSSATDELERFGIAPASAAEQQVIRDELIRRNVRAWQRRSQQVRQMLGEADCGSATRTREDSMS